MAAHLSKLKNLWNELNSGLVKKNEVKLPEMLLNCKILDILPSEYRTFKSSWLLLSEDKRTVDELTTQLCSHEREFKSQENSNKVEQEALIVKTGKGKQYFLKKNNGKCHYCHLKGHWIKTCSKWIADGRPPKPASDLKKLPSKDTSCIASTLGLLSVDGEVFSSQINSDEWYIDNGASRHITMDNKNFIKYEKFESPHSITVANGKILPALGKGTLKIVTEVNGQKQYKELIDVWYVPEISKNLFSVLAAHDRLPNSRFESIASECWLKIDNFCVLHGTRNEGKGLYKASMKVLALKEPVAVNVATSESSLLQLYHERWGHQDKRHVKSLLNQELGIKMNIQGQLCEACIFGKAHRLSFGTRGKSSKAGELISTDVCGPFDKSYRKFQYFVAFKDHFTKFRCVFFLRQKSDVVNALKDFLAYAKNLGHNVKELLSDNGGEFDNNKVRMLLQKNGVTQRLTAPYTPEQNGGSERENRTIVEMARTLKNSNAELDFPPAMWAELINTSVYILNRTGKSSIKNVSPYELWTDKKPRIKHMRIIGSSCYAHIPKQRRRKMDNKAQKGYLIGYDGDERYRLWIKESNSVICSRDVTFNEKLINCEGRVQLSIQDQNRLICESKNQEKSEDNESGKESKNEEDFEDESEKDSDEEKKEHFDQDNIQPRCLRNRSKLKRPKRFDEYIMAAEAFIADFEEPETYNEAINCKQSAYWKEAMDSEMASLIESETWTLEKLPKDAKAISCKWVYKIKKNPDGSIDKYKARLVAKGFSQRFGIDYDQTFSPVTKLGSIRSILSIAANEKMHLTQFDVCSAFLYGTLEESIYMKQPEGYSDGSERVCKLKRSLYGLKQASRCWNKYFGDFLSELGFKTSEADSCVYIKIKNGKKLIICLYVDDGLVAASDLQESSLKN